MNEDGNIAEEDHEAAVDLAVKMARAISDHPKAFLEWYKTFSPA